MRILHISKYYFPYIGGVENICKYLVDNAGENECAVVCFNEGRSDLTERVDDIQVYRVGSWLNLSRQALSPTYFRVLHKAIREFHPDIIQLHWANPFPAAVLLTMLPKDVKLVIHWHMDIVGQSKIYPFIRPIESKLLKRADSIVVTSPLYGDGSKPLWPYHAKVRVVPNAFDKEMFDRMYDEKQIAKIRALYGGKKIVFFVGRHIPYKGLSYLLEAEMLVRHDCVFVIAGSGPLTESLKASCHSKRVRFVGRLSDEQLVWHHFAASVFAFPSITKNEAFGVALAEAMYCHTPAVTFTIEGSGVNWVNINGQTGIEVPNKDVNALAAAIDRLLGDSNLSQQYAEAAHQRALQNFTIPMMVNEMNNVYNELYEKV